MRYTSGSQDIFKVKMVCNENYELNWEFGTYVKIECYLVEVSPNIADLRI